MTGVNPHDSESYLFNLAAVRDAVGEEFDGTDESVEPEAKPEPAPLIITTLAGNRVPIDPFGRSWDAP